MERSSDADRREWDATVRRSVVLCVPVAVFFGLRFFVLGEAGPVVSDPAVYMALTKAVAGGEGYYEIWRPVPIRILTTRRVIRR